MLTAHVNRCGGGVPLVLFHGWGFDSRIWHTILPTLIPRYDVYCVDLPGFGLSPFMDWEAFKSSVLSQLPAVFAVAGWSLGGLVATRFALEEPYRITHLINLASSPHFVGDSIWPGIPQTTLEVFCNRLTNAPEKVLREFMALQLPGQLGETFASPTIEGLQAGLDWLLTWDFRANLSSLKLPVLYLFGRLDAIIPRRTMTVMQVRYPNFQYVMVSKAAHALFLSHQDVCVTAISDFILLS